VEYIYSFAGTDFTNVTGDGLNDIQQALGFNAQQYNQAVESSRILDQWADENNINLTFTGHSLGGGLANVAGLRTGRPALLFNPAGLHNNTISRLNLNLSNSNKIKAFVVKGEEIDGLNTISGTPVRGNITKLNPNGPAVTTSIHLHLMGAVLRALGCN